MMTDYFCAVTVTCGHKGCNKEAYIETGHSTACKLLQHKLMWHCQQHHGEQRDDLSMCKIEEYE